MDNVEIVKMLIIIIIILICIHAFVYMYLYINTEYTAAFISFYPIQKLITCV